MPRTPVPGPIVIPACIQIRQNWVSGGREWHVVLHGAKPTSGLVDQALATTLANAFTTALTSSGWVTHLPPATQFDGVTVKDLTSANLPEFNSNIAPTAGTGTAAAAPLNAAVVVTLRTAKAGRQWRGRSYLGGFGSDALTTPTQIAGAAGTAAAAFVEACRQGTITNGCGMGLAQRALAAGTDSHGNPLAARAAHLEPITACEMAHGRIDSQRRRTGR